MMSVMMNAELPTVAHSAALAFVGQLLYDTDDDVLVVDFGALAAAVTSGI